MNKNNAKQKCAPMCIALFDWHQQWSWLSRLLCATWLKIFRQKKHFFYAFVRVIFFLFILLAVYKYDTSLRAVLCVCLLELMRQRAKTQLVGLNCQLVVKHIEESYLHSKTNQLPHLHKGVFRTNAKGKKVRSSLALLLISILGTLFVFGWQRVLFCKQCVPQRTHTHTHAYKQIQTHPSSRSECL